MTDQEITTTTNLLKKLPAGFLPYPIFEQMARIMALPVVEFIPLRRSESGVEVLLIDRGPDDPIWPNALHTPGTVIRATDLNHGADNQIAFERIIHDELHDTNVGEPHSFGNVLHESKRGIEQAQLYWIEVTGEPQVGTFYGTQSLPANLIDSQRDFIISAARDFETFYKGDSV